MSEETKQKKTRAIKFPVQDASDLLTVQKAETEKELDDYLDNEFNLEIYEDLTEGDWQETFESPLAFFRLLYEQFEFVKNNKSKPTKIVTTLNKLQLDEYQRYYLFYYLQELLRREEYSDSGVQDRRLKICLTFIEKEFDKLNEELFPEKIGKHDAENYFQFDFNLIKSHLKTLPNDAQRARYLIEAKTEFKQDDFFRRDMDNFVDKCDLELKKMSQLAVLKENEKRDRKTHGGSQDQNILAMYYLLDFLKAKGTATDKANFISFLTGFNSEKCRQLLSNPTKKANVNFTAFEKDIQEVQKHFQRLGLTELVKMIDNEIEDIKKDL
jgi:hypothetical protein